MNRLWRTLCLSPLGRYLCYCTWRPVYVGNYGEKGQTQVDYHTWWEEMFLPHTHSESPHRSPSRFPVLSLALCPLDRFFSFPFLLPFASLIDYFVQNETWARAVRSEEARAGRGRWRAGVRSWKGRWSDGRLVSCRGGEGAFICHQCVIHWEGGKPHNFCSCEVCYVFCLLLHESCEGRQLKLQQGERWQPHSTGRQNSPNSDGTESRCGSALTAPLSFSAKCPVLWGWFTHSLPLFSAAARDLERCYSDIHTEYAASFHKRIQGLCVCKHEDVLNTEFGFRCQVAYCFPSRMSFHV